MSEEDEMTTVVARVIEKAIEKLPHERRLFPDLYAHEVAAKVVAVVTALSQEPRCPHVSPTPWGLAQCALSVHEARTGHAYSPSEALETSHE